MSTPSFDPKRILASASKLIAAARQYVEEAFHHTIPLAKRFGKEITRLTLLLQDSVQQQTTKARPAIRRIARTIKENLQAAWGYAVETFLRLKIRIKLSLIVGGSVIVVTIIISTIALQIQERELRVQTQVLGTNIVQSLAAVAEDNLLLGSYIVLQDYVKNITKQNIPGLDHLFVVDRTGTIVAHVVPDSMNKLISLAEWDLLARTDSARAIESPESFRFIKAVTVSKREGNETKQILIGAASVGFSKAILLAPIEELKNTIILTASIVSIIVIALVAIFSKKAVHIIIVLADAARRVGMGDLKVSVATRVKDELGSLAHEFNMMVLQIREKTEMQKFVSRATAQMIAQGKEVTLGGSRRVITAMFTDIRNFTSVSESKWPEEVVVVLNHYLDLQTTIIHQNGGVVDKFLGDGIMSIFTGEKMVQQAVKAAVDIQCAVAKLNKERGASGDITLKVGIGIATGVAVMGSIGSQDRMDYTAIGDTVNLAARLCAIAEADQILVGDTVVARLNGNYKTRSEGKVAIKGKQERVPVHRIDYAPVE
ncbi:MAG TPA: adenylate/guanylate cyclase domain-containing protein [Bacteroidota bacterium]|nr:adenylate/guanylate cyclase domain-containing protein [Bacteroidota bacterium]